jgi:predicted enzyme related to lactoylglutathione lyase
VKGSAAFYGELFGWEAQEPSPEFGGYFMFHRQGVPVAGGMGDMGDMAAENVWKIYLASDDIDKSVQAAEAEGAQIAVPAAPVADLGMQAVTVDPTGAVVGIWQPGTFPGFTVLNEHGAPAWFELHTGDYDAAVSFYRSVFHWDTTTLSDTDDFRYATMRVAGSEGELAGIMDASRSLADGVPSHWSVVFEVDDTDAAVSLVTSLGGGVVSEPADSPYGRLATVTEPAGAPFTLIRSNR